LTNAKGGRAKCPSSMNETQMDQVYHYHTNWKEGKVNQMWIQQVNDKFIAIAYNPEKNVSMPMSKPRTSYAETLNWVRGWCGTFCPLY
jgi:hypothetical protein